MNEILGKDWNKEVGDPSKDKADLRSEFYDKRAALKTSLNEDLLGLQLEATPVTKEKRYLFGVLESAFGMKKAYKILKIAAAPGSGFNVDDFKKGDTVSLETNEGSSFLTKRSGTGEILEKVLISQSNEASFDSPESEKRTKESKEADPLEPRLKQVLSLAQQIVDGTGIEVQFEGEPNMNPILVLKLGEKSESVRIQHNADVSVDESFVRGNYTAFYNNEEFENFGEAVRRASLKLKPEEHTEQGHEHGHEVLDVDPKLPLGQQWEQWESKIKERVAESGFTLEVKGVDSRKTLILRSEEKNLRVRVVRNLVSRNKGDWTSAHCHISFQGESGFPNVLDAVNHALEEAVKDKGLSVTPPWKIQQHDHGSDAATDGHAH